MKGRVLHVALLRACCHQEHIGGSGRCNHRDDKGPKGKVCVHKISHL